MDNLEAQKIAGIIIYAFTLILALVFIILQLTSVIAWSWWWVLAPIWIPFVLGIIGKIFGVENIYDK